jgi:hypothetical protein
MTGGTLMSDKGDERDDGRAGVYDDVDTVPPPAGESDPYSAATRVGAIPEPAVLAAMKEGGAPPTNPLAPPPVPKFGAPKASKDPTTAVDLTDDAIAELEVVDGVPVLHDGGSTKGNTQLYVAPRIHQPPPSTSPPSVPLPALAPTKSPTAVWILVAVVIALALTVLALLLARN